ncbi:symplekin scaffold protein isoform X2 [Oratosquilla oratoria]|uniref:symplekin scaffold protein isoform X2 n=1 Tax=Oratosquilla oratoria TaxID=337810 RepID=UPI003F764FCB
MSDTEVSTRDRVVELLNQATLLTSEKEKISNLSQVQELIVHKEPQLLDSFYEEVAVFQTDRNSDVRKYVVGFIEEACKKDKEMLPRLIPNLQLLMADEAMVVVKRVVQASTQLYRIVLSWLSNTRTITQEMEQTWLIMTAIKTDIIGMIDHDNDGVRTQAIKFLEALVLIQTYTEADSIKRDNEFNLDHVPLTLKIARPRKLEEEARMVLGRLISFQGSIHISSVNLMTCMSSLTIIAKGRPQFMGKVINALKKLYVNLPPTLTRSQVNSVRKHLKIQLLNLLKHTAAYDYHEDITTLLNDIGVTATEVNKSMPSKDDIKNRVKRERLTEERADNRERPKREPPSKRARLEPEVKEDPIFNKLENEEDEKAVQITQKWVASRLNIELVTNLVMVSMASLPDEMPPQFSINYTPVSAAGTQLQIQQLSRLIAIEFTNSGVGPGVEQRAENVVGLSGGDYDSDDEGKELISTVVGGTVGTQKAQKDSKNQGPVLIPAGVTAKPLKHKIKTVKLSEVTKPMATKGNADMQLMIFKRLLQSDKVIPVGSVPKQRMRILGALASSLSEEERETLQDYILDDLNRNSELLFLWLYAEYSVAHDFSQLNNILYLSKKKEKKSKTSYDEMVVEFMKKLALKPQCKERDEIIQRIFLESPSVPENLISSLLGMVGQSGDVLVVVNLLKDITLLRPVRRKKAVETLAKLATHDSDAIREQVLTVILELCKSEKINEEVTASAKSFLNMLLQPNPPESLRSHNLGRQVLPMEWTEPTVKACLFLYLALLPINQSIIHDLAQVYVKTVNEAKRTILRLLEGPIRHIGMDSSELLALVETCPKGGETLITRIMHILTEKAPPSEALVCRVRELYNRRVSDVRFLIPVLTGLSKKEVIAVLPKLIKLNQHVVREVFNRLWGVNLDTGTSPLTPVDLLVALHLIDAEKCDVKTVIKATGLCFAERSIYTAEILGIVLQQLMEQPSLPTLFMRTVIQTLTHYPKLQGFIMNILQRLISKQVWKHKKVWEGFIKCCQRTTPQSFTVLLQLPATQLEDVFNTVGELQGMLRNHISTFTDNQRAHISRGIMELIEGPEHAPQVDIEEDMGDDLNNSNQGSNEFCDYVEA